MRAVILSCLGTLCWTAAAVSGPPPAAGYHLVLARLLAAENQESEAAKNFAKAIELWPSDPYVRLEYGKFLIARRRLVDAAQEVAEARQLAPDDVEVLRVYAEIQMQLVGQDPAALPMAREALEKLRVLAPSDVESMVTLGQIYLSESRPDEAAEVFQDIVVRTSGNRMVYRLLVDALMRAGQIDRAQEVLREALELDPLFTRARIVLAELLGQAGGHREAVEILEAAPPSEAGDLDLQKRLALELHRAGDLEGALAAVDRVLQREPNYYGGLYLKTVILSLQGMNLEATELCKRLVAVNPVNLEVVVLLAQLLERQRRTDEAVEELVAVEARLRGAGEEGLADRARVQRAIVLARAERWSELVELLEPRLPELEETEEVDLLLLYADAQSRLGEEQRAIAILSRLQQGSTAKRTALAKHAEILFRLGRDDEADLLIADLMVTQEFEDLVRAAEVYQRLERYSKAIPILEQALEIEPKSTQVMFWLGASYERTDRHGDAEEMLESLLQIDPNFAPALNYLGYMWAEQGQHLERALRLVRQAVALEPDNGAYVDSLGWAHFQLGQYDEAKSYLERAANLVGDDAVVFEHLGDLYVVLGLLDEARDVYRRALALEGENARQVQQKLEQLPGDL